MGFISFSLSYSQGPFSTSSKLHIKAAPSREPSQMKQVNPDNPDLLSLGPQQLFLFLSCLPLWLGTNPSPHI